MMLTSSRATLLLRPVPSPRPAAALPPTQLLHHRAQGRRACCCLPAAALPSRRDMLLLSTTLALPFLPSSSSSPQPALAATEAVIPSITSSPRGFLDVIVTFVPPAQQQLRELLERREFAQAAQAVAPRGPTQFQAAGEAIALGFDDVFNSAKGLVDSLQPLDQQTTAKVKAEYDNFLGKTNDFRQLCLEPAGADVAQAVEVRQDALDAMFEALDGLVDTANTILTQPGKQVDTA